MSDIKLDLDQTSQYVNDLFIEEGDLVIVDSTEAILQDVLQTLRTYLGEWFLDNEVGLPYYQQVLIKNPDQGKIDAIFLNAIINVVGIQSVTDYSFVIDPYTRQLNVSFKAIATTGTVAYSGNV